MKKRWLLLGSVGLSLVIIISLLLSSAAYAVEPVVDHLIISPDTAVNELSEDNQHSITVTVYDIGDNLLSDVEVTFTVGGANPGAGAIGTTDANGEVTFTYTVPQELDSLGTDEITITADGITATVTKDWVDTTPPEVSYEQGINPGGKTIPKAFYELIATDGIDPNPQIFVSDTGSGAVFGPFASGVVVKYTIAKGAIPNMTYIGPSNIVSIRGQGPAELTAVDASGNTSTISMEL